jgi:glycosyltransferase involved in cell wall biosynthesis
MTTSVKLEEAPAVLAAEPAVLAEQATPEVDFALPVFNEEHVLDGAVRRLTAYLRLTFPFTFRITVADNASTDGTLAVAERLAAEIDEVRVVHFDRKGRGHALGRVWAGNDAAVLAYMDVDLSTDLRAVLPLVAPLVSGHSDIAIGSRLARGSRVTRSFKREVVSRAYNVIVRTVLRTSFTDAQCGFKAGRREAIQGLLPAVADGNWFFDTELLFHAERGGMRIHEVPVDWVEDADSRVAIARTALEDLRGIARLLSRQRR